MSKSTSRMILAGLFGLAAGVTLGFLFAPDEGSKTRKKIKEQAKKVTETVESEFGDTVEGIKSFLRKGNHSTAKNPEAAKPEV
jgi:gas vesicle protein